jgi:ABC-type sulfate/molybdate transport systems ATPase subunit
LRRLHDEIHVTSVFVTHDQDEALEVADRVVVMNEGGIEQVGTPEEVYDRPANPFVYNFLGNVNLFHGRVDKGEARIGDISINLPEFEESEAGPASPMCGHTTSRSTVSGTARKRLRRRSVSFRGLAPSPAWSWNGSIRWS